jgi:hypothetical protein
MTSEEGFIPTRNPCQTAPNGMVTTLFDYEGPDHANVKAFEQRVSEALQQYFWVTGVQDRLTVSGELRDADGTVFTRSIGIQQIDFNPNWPF